MSDTYPLHPLPMLELPGLPRWTPERLVYCTRFIERLESWIPDELAETAVSRFVEDTIDEILRKSYSEDDCDLVRKIASRLEQDGRPNIHRVLDRIIRNAIETEGINPVKATGDRGWVWDEFHHLEAVFLRRQFVLLWLDMLTYARNHHSTSDEDKTLTDFLIPMGLTLGGKVDPYWRHLPLVGRFEPVLLPRLERDWSDEFIRLLTTACCTLSGDLFNIQTTFQERVKQEIQKARGFLILLDADGRRLSIMHTTDGIDTVIAPITDP